MLFWVTTSHLDCYLSKFANSFWIFDWQIPSELTLWSVDVMANRILSLGITFVSLVLFSSQAFAEPECVTAFGTTACGYHCISAFGEVKCAQTPYGVCKSAFGEIVCWDPSRPVNKQAECVTSFGKITCGYNCVSAFGETKCAETPEGTCKSSSGNIECWDPEPQNDHHQPHQQFKPHQNQHNNRPSHHQTRPQHAPQPVADSHIVHSNSSSQSTSESTTSTVSVSNVPVRVPSSADATVSVTYSKTNSASTSTSRSVTVEKNTR